MNLSKIINLVEGNVPHLMPFLMKCFVQYLVPANRRMGIKVDLIASDSSEIVLRLPYKKKNFNVGGTVHGSAIMALAETVHGVAVLSQFKPDNHFMFTKNLRLDYINKARSELFVRFGLTKELIQTIDGALGKYNFFELELESTVTDEAQMVIARLTAVYHIKRKA